MKEAAELNYAFYLFRLLPPSYRVQSRLNNNFLLVAKKKYL
jgi:hypothetical protein